RLFVFGALSVLGLFLACGGGGLSERRPVASLATTAQAAADFEAIREAWGIEESRRATELRPLLERFLVVHPDDGRAALVGGYLSLFRRGQGEGERPGAVLPKLSTLPLATPRDLVTGASARLLRHKGQADQALDLVRPLVGKIVNPIPNRLFL